MSTDKKALLVELGTEELPPKALKSLHDAFAKEIGAGLLDAQLIDSLDQVSPFASPRRLAVQVSDVADAQQDQTIERRGPAVQAAFDDDGNPSKAAQGFARSCGIEFDDLQRLKTDKGEWLAYTVTEQGKTLGDLIGGILEQTVKRLPIPKRMRWGNGDAEFVRPVKWLIVMHGSEVLPCQVLAIKSGNQSQGHRFHSTTAIEIDSAQNYQQTLLDKGHVIADFAKRQDMILEQIHSAARGLGGQIVDDPALLDEVTGLVEYPSPIVGDFDAEFLEVPQECLISSMRDHQKYFHVVDAAGKLMPHFITLSNIESKNPAQVKSGNEKVLRARLSDAQFFWQTDQKVRLESRVDRLESVMFHAKLGSVLDKTNRLEALVDSLATKLSADSEIAKRAARLSKADLVSDMVGEFDELQGVMGHYYADRDGEPELVGDCIEQHYWPKFAGDELPHSLEAQTVSMADKLDSLVGIFAAVGAPTGDKDPFGLRRAALSLLRLLIEKQHSLALSELVSLSSGVYAKHQAMEISAKTQQAIVEFVRSRLLAFYQAQSIATTHIKAVLACAPDRPLDFQQRLQAIVAFSNAAEAQDLAAANKRISNILKKQDNEVGTNIDKAALSHADEIALHDALLAVEQECAALFDAGDYQQGLAKLAGLRTPVDTFFENVMVMSEQAAERTNRLALLKRLQALFLRVADISLLQAS